MSAIEGSVPFLSISAYQPKSVKLSLSVMYFNYKFSTHTQGSIGRINLALKQLK